MQTTDLHRWGIQTACFLLPWLVNSLTLTILRMDKVYKTWIMGCLQVINKLFLEKVTYNLDLWNPGCISAH